MKTIKFGPSQWVNAFWIWLIIFCAAGIIFGAMFHSKMSPIIWMIPIPLCLWKIVEIACWSYELDLNGETIIHKKGVLSQEIIEIHYFRIKSVRISKPISLRMFGLANVTVLTSEPFMPILKFYAINENGVPTPEALNEFLLESARNWRNKKGVKETDFHSF